jgi:hypothetical protein
MTPDPFYSSEDTEMTVVEMGWWVGAGFNWGRIIWCGGWGKVMGGISCRWTWMDADVGKLKWGIGLENYFFIVVVWVSAGADR